VIGEEARELAQGAAARKLAAAAAARTAARDAERAATRRVRHAALAALDAGLSWRRVAELGQVQVKTLQKWRAAEETDDR
jgi:hypothetical protein